MVAGEDGIIYYDAEGKQIGGDEPTSTPEATATVTPTATPATITKPSAVKGFKAKAEKSKLQLSWKKISKKTK